MRRGIITKTAWVMALLVLGCGSGGESVSEHKATLSSPPQLGKADGADLADRSCQVVLRDVGRVPSADSQDYLVKCSAGVCNYVWRGHIDVSESVSEEARVFVLYHLTSDPNWYEVEAEPLGLSRYGYRQYVFEVSEGLFGPKDGDGWDIEMVAFLRFPDGRRLFDHNTFAGDFENAHLTKDSNFGGKFESCPPQVGVIFFFLDFSHQLYGQLRQGGYLEIKYAVERLPECRNTHNGYPCWDTVAHLRFFPGEQEVSGSVVVFASEKGSPPGAVEPMGDLVVKIPSDAERVEIWFENYSGCGSSCRTWDSNYGANYSFEIWPPPDHPRCLNIEKDNPNVHSEDFRMPHNEPYCLSYDVAANYDANYCEFWPEDFGLGYVGHYGIPFRWIFANLRIGSVEGQVLNAGMFTRFHESKSGKEGVMYSLGNEQLPGQWRVGFAYEVYGQREYVVDEFAFFIDVKRQSGEVVRLWQSRNGSNYRLDDILSLPTYSESIPYGYIKWADQAAVLFDPKRACAK